MKVTLPFIRMDGTRLETMAVAEFNLTRKRNPADDPE